MHSEIRVSLCITRPSRVGSTRTITVQDHPGGMIARTLATREERTSRIIGMVRIKWQQLSMSSRMLVTLRDLRMTARHGARTNHQTTNTVMRVCWMDHVGSRPRTPASPRITELGHELGQSSWYPPRAPARPAQAPLTGANAEALQVHQNMRPAGSWQDNANRVIGPAPVVQQVNLNSANNQQQVGPSRQNEYREHHQAYVVFVTEPDDKKSQ